MYSEELEMLIDAALEDGELTEKEKQVLFKRAQAEGIDLDEFEMIINARLLKKKKAQQTNVPPSAPAPQSNKIGEMQKCPVCGTLYVSGTAACPECGYAFVGIKATSSSELLYQQLLEASKIVRDQHATRDQQRPKVASIFDYLGMGDMREEQEMQEITTRKKDIIQNFPVPNSREDLLAFLASIQPKCNPKGPRDGIRGDGNEDLGLFYWQLYCNCILKSRISFANDPAFARYFAFYDAGGNEKKGLFGRFRK